MRRAMPEPSAKSKEKQKIPFFSRLQVKYALSYLALLAINVCNDAKISDILHI